LQEFVAACTGACKSPCKLPIPLIQSWLQIFGQFVHGDDQNLLYDHNNWIKPKFLHVFDGLEEESDSGVAALQRDLQCF